MRGSFGMWQMMSLIPRKKMTGICIICTVYNIKINFTPKPLGLIGPHFLNIYHLQKLYRLKINKLI